LIGSEPSKHGRSWRQIEIIVNCNAIALNERSPTVTGILERDQLLQNELDDSRKQDRQLEQP
jgi:hypothetical protein